jgi:ATP-dependent helicase/nuclease subunit B
MYYFYIVLSAAKKNLTITYSKFENGIELTPSHYLNDIAEAFGIEESENSKETIEDLLIQAGLLLEGSITPKNINTSQKAPQIKPLDENEIITIEDIAIYEFCPRRFYYEKTLSHEHVYSTMFHIQNFAISCLHEEAITKLVEKFPTISAADLNRIERTLPAIINEAESKIKVFFPIGQRFWEDVKIKTEVHLLNLIERILSQTDHKYANLSLKTQSHQIKIGPYTFYGERQLQVNYPTITHYYAIRNMKKILSFHTNEHWDEQKRLKEIKNNYFNLLSNFCRKESVAESSLHYYAEKIASNDFPKRTGAHCNYCVFQNACKEKEIQRNEVD